MRRLLLLLTVVLAGCGPAQPTPHEKYVAAAAEFDRENAKLTQLVAAAKDAEFRAWMVDQFFSVSDSMLFAVPLPRYVLKGRGAGTSFAYLRYRELFSEVIAAREQFELVEPLRKQANEARAEWIASTRPR